MSRYVLLLMVLSTSLLGGSSVWEPVELSLGGGYSRGWEELTERQGGYQSAPLFLSYHFDLGKGCGWTSERSTFHGVVEPFYGFIFDPEKGVEGGVALRLAYSYALHPCLKGELEAGLAPGYLGVATLEQGESGFNFFDEIGVGVKYLYGSHQFVRLGLRLRHISHGDLRESNNGGIDGFSVVVSVGREA